MGFRAGAYATVWQTEPKSDTVVRARISVSRKNKDTGEFEDEFAGYVAFVGTAVAKRAAALKEKDRIQIKDCDVRRRYVKETGKEYLNFDIFDFDPVESRQSSPAAGEHQTAPAEKPAPAPAPAPVPEPEEPDLPF